MCDGLYAHEGIVQVSFNPINEAETIFRVFDTINSTDEFILERL